MKIERVKLRGFRCFGNGGSDLTLEKGITTFVGSNGAGKTATLQALSRIFGISAYERTIKKSDFHLAEQQELASGSELSIDVLLGFPELDDEEEEDNENQDDEDVDDDEDPGDSVPEFFQQMAASAPNGPLKVRIVLRARWVDDGTPDGTIEEEVKWVRSLEPTYDWEVDCQKVAAIQRSAIQFVYVPAARNVHDQVGALLRGRLWQAARWSDGFREVASANAEDLQVAFQGEGPAALILEKVECRWRQVHDGDTDTTPVLKLIDREFSNLIKKADFAFTPNEAGKERSVAELSDGQRSLFHVALTAAILEVEQEIFGQEPADSDFDQERLRRAYLTVLAIEEPENSLSPFFLSRIVRLSREIGQMDTAQVLISSHSPAIVGRIEAEEVRYFRHDRATRCSTIQEILLPDDDAEAKRYVRLAVRAYPELYFARFVILGEGESEKIVIPRIAEAMGIDLDPSFVPIVPLGGRYCGHFWKLLSALKIPYATLLDFDFGRVHGGAKMVQTVVERLAEIGENLEDTSQFLNEEIIPEDLETLTDKDLWVPYDDCHWQKALEEKGVYFSDPMDIDFSMINSFPRAYKVARPGGTGPRNGPIAVANARKATVKKDGNAALYDGDYDSVFLWYSYLFISGSKPDAHLASLGRIKNAQLAANAPSPLKSLIEHVKAALQLDDEEV